MMGTEYTITVVGFNSVDEGAPSDVTEATNIDREFTGAENQSRKPDVNMSGLRD